MNIKLIARFPLDSHKDSMGRSWAGWDEEASDEENWDHNRGRYRFSAAIDDEQYATLSYDGVIRVVAEITGRTHTPVPEKSGTYWALEGNVLPVGHPVRDALVGTPGPEARAIIQYLPDAPVIGEREAFLLTWNPANWDWPEEELEAAIAATAAGSIREDRWATGSRRSGIQAGDRAFLLKQGVEPRGIIASGTFRGGVFQQEHWRHPGRDANYADIDWDKVLDPDAVLPLEDLRAAVPDQDWAPQGSGTRIKPENLADIESLWRQHVAGSTVPTRPGSPQKPRRSRGQGWIQDQALRKQVENAAQDRLMQHYVDQGWHVEDTRFGNSFDARATKGDETLYLEAKGTLGLGETVIVSRGETQWAWDHPGRCVLGVLSEIEIDADGNVDAASGVFRLFDWSPEEDELAPRVYDWTPPKAKEIEIN